MHVAAVSVGGVKPVAWRTAGGPQTAIEKHSVDGPVRITFDGVEGNEYGDTSVHGDDWMKVYAYSSEDYAWWESELGAATRPGLFGEQITTSGFDLNESLVGDVWRVGTALLQIAHVRIPCQTFKGWMGADGFDDRAWVKRFTDASRCGPYLRVLEEGIVQAGDPIEIVEHPSHDLTVRELFRALTVQPDLLAKVDGVNGLKPEVLEKAAARA